MSSRKTQKEKMKVNPEEIHIYIHCVWVALLLPSFIISLLYSLNLCQVTTTFCLLSAQDKRREYTSQDDSVSGTVPESGTHFQAKLPQSPSRETWSNLRPVMPSHSTCCPLTPTSFPFIWNLFSCSPPRKVTPSEILHLLSLSLRFPLPMMDELHSGVSEPVHQSLRLGIKNCQRFTKATPHFFSSSPNAASHPTKLATPLPKPLYRKIPHHHHQHDIPMQPNILSPVQMHQTPTFI